MAMPDDSIVYVYGALSEEPCGNIDPVQLIFHSKEVKGFYLGEWMRHRGTLGILRIAGRIQRMIIDGRIESVVQRRVGLNDAKDGLAQYVENMTNGKALITPNRSPRDEILLRASKLLTEHRHMPADVMR